MINADNLNDAIEFDSPFTVFPGGNLITPIGIYAPNVEHSESEDIEIDSADWEPFSTGYTGQHGYSGAVMHASEQLTGALAADILVTPGTYVVCVVNAYCGIDDAECYDGDSEYRRGSGCDCEPAGWTVLRLKD